MKIESALEIVGKLDAASRSRLKSYQVNLSSGGDKGIFDDKARDLMLEISKDGGALVSEVNQYMDSIHWNQSTFTPEMLDQQVNRFAATHVVNRAWRRKFKHIKDNLLKEVSGWSLQTIRYNSTQDIVDALPRLDTHAGFSFILTGNRYKGDYKEGLLESYLREETKARRDNSFNKPILLGYRTQSSVPINPHTGEYDLGGKNPEEFKKTRLVSMIDIYQVLAECRYAVPFQKAIGQTDWYMGGKNDGQISSLIFEKGRHSHRHWVSLDYSKYDQSIPAWLIREAFDIVREAFQQDEFDDQLFTIIREDFIHKVFITANGLVEAHDGVPSGSMFTQIIDSIVNRLMIDTYMAVKGISDYQMFIMGDDNLIYTSEKLNTKDIENYLRKNFGIEMNASKADEGMASEDPLFLSRFWTPVGPFRHPRILIAKLLFPERRREYEKYDFTPAMVLDGYFNTFRVGMDRIFDYRILQRQINEFKRKTSADKYLTGLERYRALYLSS